MNKEILRVVVGSQAHGLATPESDYDYKSIYIVKTSELLQVNIGSKYGISKQTVSSKEDETNYELHHFLSLAVKSNPSILEVFKSPIDCGKISWEGKQLRELFTSVWSSKGVFDSYLGFSKSQRMQVIKGKKSDVNRYYKFNTACIRSLLNGIELLKTGDFSIFVKDDYEYLYFPIGYDSWLKFLMDVKAGKIYQTDIEYVYDMLTRTLEEAYRSNPDKKVDIKAVNDYLLRVRKLNW